MMYDVVLRNEVDEMAIPLKLSLSREETAPHSSLFHDSSRGSTQEVRVDVDRIETK
jgi:hypothetical protein